MATSTYPHLPVMLVDDEIQALDSFELALRSGNVNNFVRCQDSRDITSISCSASKEMTSRLS